MPFALIGFFLAVDKQAVGIDWKLFVLVILCMVFARSAAMGFNHMGHDDASEGTSIVRDRKPEAFERFRAHAEVQLQQEVGRGHDREVERPWRLYGVVTPAQGP